MQWFGWKTIGCSPAQVQAHQNLIILHFQVENVEWKIMRRFLLLILASASDSTFPFKPSSKNKIYMDIYGIWILNENKWLGWRCQSILHCYINQIGSWITTNQVKWTKNDKPKQTCQKTSTKTMLINSSVALFFFRIKFHCVVSILLLLSRADGTIVRRRKKWKVTDKHIAK